MKNFTLTPAYGRDYKSKTAAIAAWIAGKDFQIAMTGQYCSIRDKLPGDHVTLRYNKLQESVQVSL